MDYQSLHLKTVVDLKKLAKEMGVRVPSGTNKNVLIELLLEADRAAKPAEPVVSTPTAEPVKAEAAPEKPRRGRPRKTPLPEASAKQPETAKADAPKPKAPAKPASEIKPATAQAALPEKKAEATSEAPVEPPKASAPTAPKPAAPAQAMPKPAAEKPAEASKSAPKPAGKVATPAAPVVADKKPDARDTGSANHAVQQRPAADNRRDAANRQVRSMNRPTSEQRTVRGASNPRGSFAQGEARQPRTVGENRGQELRPSNPRGVQNAPSRQDAAPRDNRAPSRQEGTVSRENVQRPNSPAPRASVAPRAYQGVPAPAQSSADTASRQQTPIPPAEAPEPRRNTRMEAAPEVLTPTLERPETPAPRPQERYYNAELKTSNPAVPELLATGECGEGEGVLEIQQDGYGFLRAENCLPGPNDVYISIAQIRRFNLRQGDHVVGKIRPQREGDRYSAMLYITQVNGEAPEKAQSRPRFEDLIPIYPDQRLRLEPPTGENDLSLRLIDMLAPIGKGQRGMIVSQPKAGKTTLLKKVANAITRQYPDIHLIVLLIDERPEEVTDMKRSIDGEVIYSTFDEAPENHTRVSEMVLERAQRLVEMGKDVVVLMDSITRLARAYNLVITPTGRSLSGGLDPGALFRPKRFFGAARNIENGGSLTVIATALVDTGSRMDDIIYEEFKGTGNMELHLDRKLSDRRVFPAIDMVRSGTRRDELLLTEAEQEGALQVRRMLSGGKSQEMSEELINLMTKTDSNAQFFQKLKGWLAVYEKEGYSRGR